MFTTIEHNDQEIEVMCVGQYLVERVGYYAGCATIENFKVFEGHDNITKTLTDKQLAELKSRYMDMCQKESA